MSKDRKAKYLWSVCDIRSKKIETHQTRLTTGGNIVDLPGEFITPTADLTTVKMHVNSVIS